MAGRYQAVSEQYAGFLNAVCHLYGRLNTLTPGLIELSIPTPNSFSFSFFPKSLSLPAIAIDLTIDTGGSVRMYMHGRTSQTLWLVEVVPPAMIKSDCHQSAHDRHNNSLERVLRGLLLGTR